MKNLCHPKLDRFFQGDALFRMNSSTVLSRKSSDSSVEILDYPARNGQILPNFEIFLPKFHFILPNFYFSPPWENSVCSLEIHDFLGRENGISGDAGSATA